MSNAKHILLGAAIGAVCGWVVGEILAEHFAPEYYTEEEMEELLAQNSEILEENKYHLDQIKPVKGISEIREEMKMGKKQKTDYGKFYKGEVKEDLQKLVAKYNDDVMDDTEEELLEEEIEYSVVEDDDDVDNRDKTDIYIMTREEWDSNETDYDQVTLNYYNEDDILTDANDKPLRSVEKLVGPDALSNFGTFSDDEHIVYVCNPHTGVEFEIIRQDGAYSDIVLSRPARKNKKGAKGIVHNVFEDAAREDQEVEEGDEQD